MAIGGNNTTATVTLNANMDPSGVLSAVKAMQGAFNNLKLPSNIGENLDKSLSKATELLKKYQSQLQKGINTKTDAKNISKTGVQINEVLDDINHYINELNGQQIFLKADVSGLNKLKTDIDNARTAWKNAIQEFRKGSDIDKVLNQIGEKTTRSNLTQGSISKAKTLFDKGDLEGYKNALDEIYNRLKSLKDTTVKNVTENLGLKDAGSKAANLEQIKKQLEAISKINFSNDANVKAQFDEITNSVGAYEAELKRAGNAGQEAFNDINAGSAINNTRALVDATDQYTNSLMSARDQVQDLQRSTQYFFSLRNMINLLKRGIDDAVQSVKELDAAMTETAVVTDYKVSDLWGMLPQYTQIANQLGATTQGAYETMTLYYQQGLEQQQAFELGAETMKMARIAGLDYAETTDMMTAALRGFNMELNETSAKRVNDVYSELAAITASDTEELGTAMQRTASIAASAGASFEGTTAFLAQAIETTREPAENIGTAMKTIVARFQEMKKNPLEISEVDGEEVDYNKIDAALKTIGVDLKDTNGQFREFDQVMLDISAKWDTLSQSQQRYIATTAAGSRQQSRFIAMVSNYDRIMQLMEAANNSAGASDEQFGKTMDSLESKLNQLHNAWQRFTMGIANNNMIKMTVDGLTGFLNITNKIIDTLSLGSGAIKSFLSLFTAFTGLKIAGRAANSLIGGLGGLVDPQSTVKEGLKIGLFGQGKTNAQAKAITTPIVGSLNKISQQISQIKNGKINGQNNQSDNVKNTSKQEYLDVKKQFDKLSGKNGFKMSEASDLFGKLDAKHQQAMFNNSPGTKLAMKQASLAWFGSRKDLSKAAIQEGKTYINSIYKGMEQGRIPVDKGIELIGQPQKWGYYLGTETAMAYSKSFVQKSIPTIKENTAIAHEAAIASLGFNPQDYKVGSKELKDLFKGNKQLAGEYASLYGGFRGDLDKSKSHGQAKGKVSDMGRFANDIGAIGDKFTQAGYGITAFGNALSQLGGPIGAVGTGISAFGSAISTMGMSISSATSLVRLFTTGLLDAEGAVILTGAQVAAFAAPLAALAAGFLLVRHHIKEVKEAGKEVTDTFNETNKTAEDNISKLKSYQGEFAQLSKGVDSNGYNVNLDDSQYQRYLEIVKDIAAINPSIVEGYNAQGHAIINNNKALEETLKLQKENQKRAFKEYTDPKALQKLINARNISSEYRNSIVNPTSSKAEDAGLINAKKTPFAADVRNIADLLSLTGGIKDFDFTKYGIDSLDALKDGEEKAVQNFVKHRQQIEADLSNSGIKLGDAVIKSFDTLGEDTAAFDEAIQPVYDNLLASISNSPIYKEIGSEFKNAISMGLKDIASMDLNASEMQSQANILVQEFENLTREGSDYAIAMEKVENAQNKFASSLDASEYAENTKSALTTLNSLLKQYEGNTTAYGQAVTEYLTNQIEKIKKFTEEGTVSLSEALNTATSNIAAAEGAYQAFQDATKTDMATGAESMKSIFDEITKETDGIQLHMQGQGDNTLWTGMSALFSEKAVEKAAEKGPEAIQKMLNRIKPMLQEGQAGFDAFWNDMFSDENYAKLKDINGVIMDQEKGTIKWDDEINPDVFHEMAEALGYSDQYLTSMLNKGRQFANINFMDMGDVRKALSTDENTIKGTSTSTITNEKGQSETVTDIFVKGDYLKNALREANIVNPQEQKEAIDRITKNGVKIIPNAQDMTKKDFQHMGISNLPSLIQKLGDTGQFNRSEIEDYARQMKDYNPNDFNTLYKDYLDSQEHPELPSINSIDNNVASIAHMIAADKGIVDQTDKDNYNKAKEDTYGEAGKMDSLSQLFSLGLNKNGEKLTADEFSATQKALQNQSNTYAQTADYYEKQAEKARKSGNMQDAQWFDNAAKKYDKMSNDIGDYIEAGIKAYKENQKTEEEQKDEEKNKENKDYRPTSAIEAEKQQKKLEYEKNKAENDAERGKAQAKYEKEKIEQAKKDAEQAKKQAEKSKQYYEQDAQNKSYPKITDLNKAKAEQEAQKAQESAQAQAQKDAVNYQQALDNIRSGGTTISDTANKVFTDTKQKIENSTKRWAPDIVEDTTAAITPIGKTIGWNVSQQLKKQAEQGVQEEKDNFVIDSKYAASALAISPWINEGLENIQNWFTETYNKINNFKIPQLSNNLTTPEVSSESIQNINEGTQIVQTIATKVVGGEEAQEKLDSIKTTADKGADMEVSATMDSTVNIAKTAVDNLKKTAQKGISVKTKVESGGAEQVQSAASKTAEMPLKIKDLATPIINRINAKARQSVTKTVNITPNYTGTWRKDVYVGLSGPGAHRATGQNNKITYHHVPQAGSAARGTKKGRVGPRGQGGMTLTGEEGYEVAWLPDESRSMILGASGPEMINLPKNAVIYNHDQSKEIMKKRKSIEVGSMGGGSGEASYVPKKTTTQSSTNNNKGTNKQNKTDDKNNKNADKAKKVINNVGKVSAYWENIARQTEATQRLMDKNAKVFEKYVKEMRATLHMTGVSAPAGGGGDDYIASINKYKQYNESQRDTAANELKKVSTSKSKTKISYKKGKKTKDKKVQLSKYIKYNDELGIYEINQDELNKVKNKNEAKAIKEAAEKKINEKQSKKNTAEDNIQKAEEALEKFGEELYKTFFAWETELTEIWNITQKIAEVEKRISRTKAYTELLEARIASGTVKANEVYKQSISNFETGVLAQRTNLNQNIDALKKEREDLQRTMSLGDEKATLNSIKGFLSSGKGPDGRVLNETDREGYVKWGENLEQQINALDDAWKYLTVSQKNDGTLDVDFKTDIFEKDKTAGLIGEEKAKVIQDYVKSLNEKSEAINSRIETITSSTAEFYSQLASLKDEWAGYADQLWDISDAEQKKEVDNFKKLSDSLDKAMKNLLDGVKQKLDERRQQEDNKKTEQDISQKQQRLAMLQADTSGGHQVEIAQLQQEIGQAQQDYQRTLEDQMLEKLEQQADIATQQREQQIALQEGTIDAINNASLVNTWLAKPENYKQQMYEAFMTANEADKKPDAIKEQLERQFEEMYLGIITNKKNQEALTTQIDQIENGAIKLSDLTGETGILNGIKASIDNINAPGKSKTVESGGKVTEGGTKAVNDAAKKGGGSSGGGGNSGGSNAKLDAYNKELANRKQAKKINKDQVNKLFKLGAEAGKGKASVLKDIVSGDPFSWKNAFKAIIDADGITRYNLVKTWPNGDGTLADALKTLGKPNTIAAIKKHASYAKAKPLAFKTGGLADYTGPAWLDGTPSKPELVLNSTDTKNFVALKDVLSKAMGSTNAIENSYGGDTTFEININVDHLNNDYDVDKVAERVKKIIVKDSSYRNVTQVRNFR